MQTLGAIGQGDRAWGAATEARLEIRDDLRAGGLL
jgi:hypothetical protein